MHSFAQLNYISERHILFLGTENLSMIIYTGLKNIKSPSVHLHSFTLIFGYIRFCARVLSCVQLFVTHEL